MAWKAKEKALTPEEAIAMAKRELAPLWFNSEPLLAGVQMGDVVAAHPLGEEIRKDHWLLFFVQPYDFSGALALRYIAEWYRRFNAFPTLRFLLVVIPPHDGFLPEQVTQQVIRHYNFSFPCMLDQAGYLARAFQVNRMPKLVLLKGGQAQWAKEGEAWFQELESDLQKFIRSFDPGAPFLSVFHPKKNRIQDAAKIDFNSEPGKLVGVQCKGNWRLEGSRWLTADPEAELSFEVKSPVVALVAEGISKLGDPAKVVVEMNQRAVTDAMAGTELHHDEEGNSFARIQGFDLYPIIAASPGGGSVTLRFPTADRITVALYSVCFGVRID